MGRRPQVKHAEIAAALCGRPGQWMPIGAYGSKGSAACVARDIRSGYQRGGGGRRPSPYAPAGAYEAYPDATDDGWQVKVRYVGTKKGGTR